MSYSVQWEQQVRSPSQESLSIWNTARMHHYHQSFINAGYITHVKEKKNEFPENALIADYVLLT